MKLNVLRPVFPDGTDLTALTATVVHAGRNLAIREHRDRRRDGRRVALATGTTALGDAAAARAAAALAYE